jgi:hypothetical protein
MSQGETFVKSGAILAVVLYVGLMGSAGALAADFSTSVTLPYTIIIHRLGETNGFGFGSDACPIGCTLPMPPVGSTDPPPFDTPDSPCVLTRSWTHDFRADLPEGAQVISALLVVNAAGIQPEIFASGLSADSREMPLSVFHQGTLGSGLVPVPLIISDLADGLLQVTIHKGIRTRTSTICDDQFYDSSMLIMLVQLP